MVGPSEYLSPLSRKEHSLKSQDIIHLEFILIRVKPLNFL